MRMKRKTIVRTPIKTNVRLKSLFIWLKRPIHDSYLTKKHPHST